LTINTMGHPVSIDFFFQLFLIFFGLFLDDRFGVLVFIGTGFDMGGVDKPHIGGHKAMPNRFFQDALEDGFKQVGTPETADVVFPESGKVGNGLSEVVTDKPTVSNIGFDFFDSLPHGTFESRDT